MHFARRLFVDACRSSLNRKCATLTICLVSPYRSFKLKKELTLSTFPLSWVTGLEKGQVTKPARELFYLSFTLFLPWLMQNCIANALPTVATPTGILLPDIIYHNLLPHVSWCYPAILWSFPCSSL